jgi:hypothetical protein
MPAIKPLVAIATVCERVLQEKDDVMSIIRVVDVFTLPQDMPNDYVLPLTIAVFLRAGAAEGTFELQLQVRKPNGEIKTIDEKWPVVLNGGSTGANLIVQFGLKTEGFGLYWVDVLCDSDVLTSVPVKLQHPEESSKMGSPPSL